MRCVCDHGDLLEITCEIVQIMISFEQVFILMWLDIKEDNWVLLRDLSYLASDWLVVFELARGWPMFMHVNEVPICVLEIYCVELLSLSRLVV